MRTALSIGIAVLCLNASSPALAQEAATPDPWAGWQWLMGDWITENASGGSTGSFTFSEDLGGKILVRKNHAEVPAIENRPVSRRDDMMVVFYDPSRQDTFASYWDNEWHYISYRVDVDGANRNIVMTSNPGRGPRFRLTYRGTDPDRVRVVFGMADPGTEDFKVYMDGTARRVK